MEPSIVIEQRQTRSWEEILSDGMNAREQKDNSQWILGDLASEVASSYGDDTIGKYAYEVGIPRKTLMNYRTVSARFPSEMRQKYRKLSFSHFAVTTGLEEPEAWLEKADDNDWSVEGMRKELAKSMDGLKGAKLNDKPPEAYRCPECGMWRMKDVSRFEICAGHYSLKGGKLGFT